MPSLLPDLRLRFVIVTLSHSASAIPQPPNRPSPMPRLQQRRKLRRVGVEPLALLAQLYTQLVLLQLQRRLGAPEVRLRVRSKCGGWKVCGR